LDYIVNINKFHGPFDLLFYLIEANEVDIYDIPISEITDQYIGYIELLNDFNMEITSEFVLMASTLLEIKSKLLLPRQEIDEDPRDSLVVQLIEYKLFRDTAEELKEREDKEFRFISKPGEEIEYDNKSNEQLLFDGINAYDLMCTLQRLLKSKKINVEEDFSFQLEKDEYTITDCIDIISGKLDKLKKLNILELFSVNKSRKFIITVFLSILEMSKLKNVKLIQDSIFGDIYIQKT
jgi:segregation and condensation protein A